jgi:hypothetical protein
LRIASSSLRVALVGDALGVHAHESEHAQPDLVAVDLGVIALDEAGFLQRPHAPPAGRGRQAHALRQLGVGEAAVGLQFLQDCEVELVNAFHGGDIKQDSFWKRVFRGKERKHLSRTPAYTLRDHGLAPYPGTDPHPPARPTRPCHTETDKMNAPLPEHIRKALETVTLDDKYSLDYGRAFMSGVQALVKLPMLQRTARREQACKNTAGFISGYRGSPLGGYDQALWKAKQVPEGRTSSSSPA